MMNAWLSMEFDSIDYSHDITTEKKQRLAYKNIKDTYGTIRKLRDESTISLDT